MTAVVALPAGRFVAHERRVDGWGKVTGQMRYAADVQRPNALWAAFAASPFARARIRRVDVAAAKAMPGVRAILTGAEIGDRRAGRQIFDWPLLARDEVRFIGDRVAAVAADTREQAEAAVLAIEVAYEELPAVFDTDAALAPEAPILHPDFSSYSFPAFDGKPRPERAHGNIYGVARIGHGDRDPEIVFAGAAHVFEQRFTTPRQHCGYLEPHATMVWIDDDGTVHVQTTHKMPFALRDQIATVIEVPREKIVIEPAAIGGDFGGKGFALDECPLYYLARATGRPVRHVQTYADELRLGTTRHGAKLELKTAVDDRGRFLAHTSRVVYDGGAYAAPKSLPWLLPGYGYGTMPYQIPDVRIELLAVYTNTIPSAHMRGPAEIQTCFAWEQHIDTIAHGMGIDPLEMRLLNQLTDGHLAVNGDRVERTTAREVLAALRHESGAGSRLGRDRGRGIALICGRDGGGTTAVAVSLTAEGRVEVTVGVPDQGTGAHTVVQRVVAAALNIDDRRVFVRRAGTDAANPDPGAGASRVTHIVGRAAQDGGERLRSELQRGSASEISEATFDGIAQRACAQGPLEVVGRYDGSGPPDYAMSAYAIDVEVDRETGKVDVLGAVLVVDVGEIINPTAHRGQLEGGFVFGLGCADRGTSDRRARESHHAESGRVQAPDHQGYRAAADDLPARSRRARTVRCEDGR